MAEERRQLRSDTHLVKVRQKYYAAIELLKDSETKIKKHRINNDKNKINHNKRKTTKKQIFASRTTGNVTSKQQKASHSKVSTGRNLPVRHLCCICNMSLRRHNFKEHIRGYKHKIAHDAVTNFCNKIMLSCTLMKYHRFTSFKTSDWLGNFVTKTLSDEYGTEFQHMDKRHYTMMTGVSYYLNSNKSLPLSLNLVNKRSCNAN